MDSIERQAAGSYVDMLAAAVRRERVAKGFTQEGLAALIGLNRSHMGSLDRGEHDVTFATVMSILEGLQAEPSVFFRDIRLLRASNEFRKPSGQRVQPQKSRAETYAAMLGEAVRFERRRAGILQEELANESGFTRSYMSSIECGKGNPKFTLLMRMLEHLGVEPEDFFQHIHLLAKRPDKAKATSVSEERERRAARWALRDAAKDSP